MKYGIVFLLVAGILIYYGGLIGGWGWLLLWPALSFSIVASAYLGSGVKVFGKRRDGTIAWYSLVSCPMNTITFVASATASSSRNDDDAMSVCITAEE